MSSVQHVRSILERTTGGLQHRTDTDFSARCPSHNDQHASLSVTWVDDPVRGGMTLLNCHGCHAPADEICSALGLTLSALFDEPPRRLQGTQRVGRSPQQRRAGQRRTQGRLPERIAFPERGPEIEHAWEEKLRYPYTNAEGVLVQEVIREECDPSRCEHCSPGDHKKQFRQVFVNAHGTYVKRKPNGFRAVLYRLPELIAAIAAGLPIWLMEGEKDADNGVDRVQLAATTNAQGGLNFPSECAELFIGATVYVVLDRDEAGWLRGVQLYELLTAVGAQVQLLLPGTTAAKSDFTDHLDAGLWDARDQFGGLIPVSVEEVAAHAAVAAVRSKLELVLGARDEASARMERADQAETNSDETRRLAEARFARSWAMESERRYEKLCDAADVVRQRAIEARTDWAAAAVDEAEVIRLQAQTAARAAHESAHLPVPEPLHAPQPDQPAPTARADPDTEPPTIAPIPGNRDNEEGGAGVRGAMISAPTYRLLDGHLVELVTTRDGDEYPKLVLSLDARLVEMEYLERDDASLETDRPELMGRDDTAQKEANPPGPEQVSAVIIGFHHPQNGDWMRIRVSADDYYRDGGWVESLPGPPKYDSRPSGLSRLRDALKAAAEGNIIRTVRYRATGWRRTSDGEWFYIHAGGAIHSAGVRPAALLMSSPLTRYDLPEPCPDPARIREAFLRDSGAMLTRLPTRVTAPLLGQIFRSALGPCGHVLLLVGSPGSFKTSIAALGMHHWGELWDRSHPGASMSGNGDTMNALRLKLYSVKDACFFADDVAPTAGYTAAQTTLETFARMVYNGEARARVTRDGQSMQEGTPPRASAIITSEVTPRPGSGGERTFPVPLVAGDIELDVLKELSRDSSRHGRALLMASFVQWLAARLPAMQALAREEAETLSSQLLLGGGDIRGSAAVGVLWSGWVVMARFLTDVGALTEDEATKTLDLVTVGLMDAVKASSDPDTPSKTGARVRELLEHALRSGIAHVEDIRTGEAPDWSLSARLGWRRTIVGYENNVPRYREDPRGTRLGYVMLNPSGRDGDEPELVVTKAALEQVLKETASKMTDAPQVDVPTAVRALYAEGVLIAEKRGAGTQPPRYTVQRTLHCEGGRRQRMTVLRLWKVIGEEDDTDPTFDFDGDPDDGPTPSTRLEDWISDASCQSSQLASDTDEPAATDTGETNTGAADDQDQDPELQDTEMRAHPPCEGQFELTLDATPGAGTEQSAPPADLRADEIPAAAPVAPEPEPPSQATVVDEPVTTAPVDGRTERRARIPVGAYTAAVAVVDLDGVWLPDGTCKPLPEKLSHVGHLAELATTLRLGHRVNDWWFEPGQLWITDAMLERLGIDVAALSAADPIKRKTELEAATVGHPLVTDALAEGWNVSKPGDRLRPWTRVWRGTTDTAIWIVLMAGMNRDPYEVPVFDEDPTPAQLARRLQLFADALNWPFRVNAQSTGFDLLFHTRWKQRRDEDWFAPSKQVPPARISQLETEFSWSRTLNDKESKRLYVHCFDRGGSHLAAYTGLSLPLGDPTHWAEGCEFDPDTPGYWRVEVTESGDLRLPHPLLRRCESTPRLVWVTTPSLDYARQLGHEPEIREAYTWRKKAKVLVPYYERCRDARTALDIDDLDAQLARDLNKTVYTRTGGMMGSATHMKIADDRRTDDGVEFREGFQPTWRHMWIAKACANELRTIVKIGNDSGEYPVAMVDDTVLYTSDNPDPIAAWPGDPAKLGRRLGQFKWEGSAVLSHHQQYLTGKPYTGLFKDELTKDWDIVNGGPL